MLAPPTRTDALLPPPSPLQPWPARRFLRWCSLALGMLRRTPLRLLLLALLPLLVEAALQFGIPVAGVIASKFVVPWVSMWALLMVDQHSREGRFAPLRALQRLRTRAGTALALSVLSAAIFGMQTATAMALVGPSAATGIALGDIAAITSVSRMQVALILASGLPWSLLLMFSAPRALLDGLPLRRALAENLQLLLPAWRPVLAYLLLTALLVIGAVHLPWLLLPALLVGYVSYWAYRDAFAGDAG